MIVDLVKPSDFFRSKVDDVIQKMQIDLDDHLEFYIVNLLCEFITPQNLTLGEMDLLDTPLALIYKEALEAPPQSQPKLYKKLGDVSLYIAGYFQASLARKTVGRNYYISMGSSAYQELSQIFKTRHREIHFTEMYSNLSKEFKTLVAVMSGVSKEIPIQSPNMLRLYESWYDTLPDEEKS